MTALEIRIIAYALLALSLIGTAAYITHRLDANHYETIIAKSDAAQEKLAATAAQAAKAQQDMADAHNREIQNGLQTTLVAISGSRDDLARRLRLATSASGHLSQTSGGSGLVNPSPNDGAGQINELLSDALTECRSNEARQNALIAELRPQL